MPVKRRRATTAIRLIGTKAEIFSMLAAFSDRGFKWRSNEYFYARIGQPDFYSYYLEDFEANRDFNS